MTDFIVPEYNLDGGGGQVLFHPSILGGGVLGVNTVRGHIQSENWVAGVSGWRISGDGNTELNELQLRGDAWSDNYVAGVSGWFLGLDGTAEFNDGVFRGQLAAATGTFAGSLSAATGTFAGSLSAATGTFAGSLSAASGTFTGTITGDQIVGGTITGVTFRTAASGTRTEINGNNINFYSGAVLQATLGPSGFSASYTTNLRDLRVQTISHPNWPAKVQIYGATLDGASEVIGNFNVNGSVDVGWNLSVSGASALTGAITNSGGISTLGSVTAAKLFMYSPGSLTATAVHHNTSSNELTRVAASSIRYKENVANADGLLTKILGLRPVRFDYKQNYLHEIVRGDNGRDGLDFNVLGFIAEEAMAVDSSFVIRNPDDPRAEEIHLVPVVAALTGAVQELTGRIETLEATI